EEKYRNIVIFVIKNCMVFFPSEVEIAFNDIEEFYLWIDTLSPSIDLKEKAGLLCRIIYDKNKKQLKDFFENLEMTLVNLISKQYSLLRPDELNLKCAILYFFDAIAYIYYNKHRNYNLWVEQIFSQNLDINYINNGEAELFSTFIIFRILTKIIA